MIPLILLLLSGAMTLGRGAPTVQMPETYTAMKEDIVVSYNISSRLKSLNAMIHLEYLPGLAIHPAIHLARLAFLSPILIIIY